MKKQDKIALERFQTKLEFARSSGDVNPFETEKEKEKAINECKKSFPKFVNRYFPHYATSEVPDFHISFAKKVLKNKTFKGGAWWGRALAKSVVMCILLPMWLWINGEEVYMVIIGNSNDKAKQLLEDIRAEFEGNPQLISDFGEQKKVGSWEDGFFTTLGGFIGQALGMGQSVRGLRVKSKRPNYIVCDDIETKDLNKNHKRQNSIVKWIERDLIPTMDGDTRRFIQANNRFSTRMVQTILAELHPNWHIDIVNAYNPTTYEPRWKAKYNKDYFKTLESEIGSLAANAEYNNDPHTEGSIFKQEHIQWGKMPRLNQFKIICGYWDVAYAGSSTSDFNAIVLQGLYDKSFWEIDAFVKQCKMREAIAWMCYWEKNKPKTIIIHWLFEAQFWNDEVERTIKEVEQEYGVVLNITKVNNPRTRKYDRILSMHPTYQNGRFFYNEKNKSHNDTQVGISQLFGIEPGYKGHDDYPDAKEGGKSFLEKHLYIGSDSGTFNFGKMRRKNIW